MTAPWRTPQFSTSIGVQTHCDDPAGERVQRSSAGEVVA